MTPPIRIISAIFAVMTVMLIIPFSSSSEAAPSRLDRNAFAVNDFNEVGIESYHRLRSNDGLGSNAGEIVEEIPGEHSEYTYENTWVFGSDQSEEKLIKAYNGRPSFRSVSISVSSNARRSISISASAISGRGAVAQIGVSRLLLQMYTGGRWMTVYGLGNRYVYGVPRFYVGVSRKNLSSNAPYRVVATFALRCGTTTTMVTRTTPSINCK